MALREQVGRRVEQRVRKVMVMVVMVRVFVVVILNA